MTTTTFAASTRMDHATKKVQWKSRFVSLPCSLLSHASFQELSGGSAKLPLALNAGYGGNNNGPPTAPFSRMKSFGFNSKETVARALRELIAFGYIVRTRTQRLREPALYAVTWLPINRALAGQPYDEG